EGHAGRTTAKVSAAYAGDWESLKEVEVTGKYTGIIKLSAPFAPLFLTTLPGPAGMIISKKAYEELGDDFATSPIGSGPYEFTSEKRGQNVIVSKFDDWTSPSEDWPDDPQWSQIEFKIIQDDHSADIALETQEVDFGQ